MARAASRPLVAAREEASQALARVPVTRPSRFKRRASGASARTPARCGPLAPVRPNGQSLARSHTALTRWLSHSDPGGIIGDHRAEARALVGFGPGGLVVRWRPVVRVAGRGRRAGSPPARARRPRLARACGPQARSRCKRACLLESSCPSPFVSSFVPFVTRPAVGSSWGTNCALLPPQRSWRAYWDTESRCH